MVKNSCYFFVPCIILQLPNNDNTSLLMIMTKIWNDQVHKKEGKKEERK